VRCLTRCCCCCRVQYAALNSKAALGTSPIVGRAFVDAIDLTRRCLGLWSHHQVDRAPEQQLAALIAQRCVCVPSCQQSNTHTSHFTLCHVHTLVLMPMLACSLAHQLLLPLTPPLTTHSQLPFWSLIHSTRMHCCAYLRALVWCSCEDMVMQEFFDSVSGSRDEERIRGQVSARLRARVISRALSPLAVTVTRRHCCLGISCACRRTRCSTASHWVQPPPPGDSQCQSSRRSDRGLRRCVGVSCLCFRG
jgi:hypothetical protein